MPHKCTSCGRTFPDGSKEMLSGCPDCGGNKFQFKPRGRVERDEPSKGGSGSSTSDTDTAKATSTETPKPTSTDPAKPTSTGSEGVSTEHESQPTENNRTDTGTGVDTTDTKTDIDTTASDDADQTPVDPSGGTERVGKSGDEDAAQANARSDVVTPDELDRASEPVPAHDTKGPDPDSGDRPDIEELREELNEQFESIRIVSPGKYELNLMELYDRQEYIISLQEDGRYVIEMPDAWGISEE